MQKLRLNPSEIISIKLIPNDNNVGHAEIVFKEWGRIESVKQHIDITNNDFLTWKYAPVMDMSIRCLIDGGARIGRQAGATGQTVEGHSFKAMNGFENAHPSRGTEGGGRWVRVKWKGNHVRRHSHCAAAYVG